MASIIIITSTHLSKFHKSLKPSMVDPFADALLPLPILPSYFPSTTLLKSPASPQFSVFQ